MEKVLNNNTLESLIKGSNNKEKAVEEFVTNLSKVAYNLYSEYKVLWQAPQSEEQKYYSHQLLFQSHQNDPLTTKEHNKMFKLAFDNNLNIYEINVKFREEVEKGNVLPLGSNIKITDTAVGNILSGNEYNFTISFMDKTLFEEKEQKEKEAEEKIKQKLEERNNG